MRSWLCIIAHTDMIMASLKRFCLTLWGSVTHVCISKLTIIGSDNGVPPGGSQVIIWTTDETLLIETLGTNFSEILNEIHTFSFKKIHSKMSPVKWRPFCLGVNVFRSSQSPCNHCDVMTWGRFPYYWPLMRGIYQKSLHKRANGPDLKNINVCAAPL